MQTIQCRALSKPINNFICKVLRPACWNVFYTPERWEEWIVQAETKEGAQKVAEYHFYRSNPDHIIIKELTPTAIG